jgi:hypothetical protein
MLLVFLQGCGVRVKHHWGFMGPDAWEATDGKFSVFSYRGECWEAEKMLEKLADDANHGTVDWELMHDDNAYYDTVMKARCNGEWEVK